MTKLIAKKKPTTQCSNNAPIKTHFAMSRLASEKMRSFGTPDNRVTSRGSLYERLRQASNNPSYFKLLLTA